MKGPIIPHLWFDKEAKEATELYTSIIPNSKVDNIHTIHNTPSGDADIVSFTLAGQPFMAISAGPFFKFNPSISFHIKVATKEEVNTIWEKLLPGGKVLMELNKYPFSEWYGWIQDKYGVSWQVIMTDPKQMQQVITPVMMFTKEVYGKAEEAMQFYTSIFPNSQGTVLMRYSKDQAPDKEGNVAYATFTLNGMQFGIMESAREHDFSFNEAISFIVKCENQEEIDMYWEKLSAHSESEQCGWLKDKYGVSWQITPVEMDEMMAKGTPEQVEKVTQAFLKMKKFDIAKLREAYNS